MSLDRVDDVSIVDKPREFRMGQQWQDQWLFFTGFITSLERRIIPAFDFHDNAVELSDSEQNLVIKLIKEDKYDAITRDDWSYDNYRMVSQPHIEMHTLRKFFLTFNRKANYEWVRERVKDGVEKYKEATERLADFSEHLDLPEVPMPTFDESLVTPFVKQTYEAVQEWLDERYDYQNKVTKKLPAVILVLRNARIILGNGNGSPAYTSNEGYFCGDLMDKLYQIREENDIESIFKRAAAGVEGIKRTFRRKE